MPRLIVMKKGGGGKVAINPEHVSFVRSAAGAFTDIFADGQQIAVEGTFDEVVARLASPERRQATDSQPGPGDQNRGLVFGQR